MKTINRIVAYENVLVEMDRICQYEGSMIQEENGKFTFYPQNKFKPGNVDLSTYVSVTRQSIQEEVDRLEKSMGEDYQYVKLFFDVADINIRSALTKEEFVGFLFSFIRSVVDSKPETRRKIAIAQKITNKCFHLMDICSVNFEN